MISPTSSSLRTPFRWRSVPVFVLSLVFGLFVWTLAGSSAFAQVYVQSGTPGSGSGTLADPYGDLQTALAATSSGEIRVATGTYVPDVGTGQTDDDRTSSFALKSGVSVLGGWATDFSSRDPASFETTLSGDIDGDGTASGNAYHVVEADGVDATAVLDGFTVAEGNADDVGANASGAGIYVNASDVTLRNLLVRDNTALSTGGGVFVSGTSAPLIEASTVRQNTASVVGGGGIGSIDADPTIRDVVIEDNTASSGGGFYAANGSPTLEDVTLTGNVASGGGGGIFVDAVSLAVVVRATLVGNESQGASGGGGFNLASGAARLTSVLFAGNTSTTGPGGAIVARDGTTLDLANGAFSGNEAVSRRGGALFNEGGTTSLTSVSFTENLASEGSAVYGTLSTSDVTLNNVVIWNNDAPYVINDGGSITFDTGLVEGGLPTGTTLATGSPALLTSDPQFADADGPDNTAGTADDDLRLLPASPALEQGDAALLPADADDLDDDGDTAEALPRDLDDVQRVLDSGSDAVDLGAYETGSVLVIRGTADDPVEDRQLGDDAGWRMIAAPGPADVGDIADDARISEAVDPNCIARNTCVLYRWDDTANNDTTSVPGNWVPITSESDSLRSGAGVILFLFDDQREPIRPDAPLIFEVPARSPQTDVLVDGLNADAQFHLVGNPFGRPFDVEGLSVGAGTDFQATVSVWDPTVAPSGAYRQLVPGESGDVVAPWQGFFVERSPGGTATTLTFSTDGLASEATFFGKQTAVAPARIALQLDVTQDGALVARDDTPQLLFRPDATDGWDVWDASRPAAVQRTGAALGFVGDRAGQPVATSIESRPFLRKSLIVPLDLRANVPGTYILRAPTWTNVPADWTVTLHDTKATPAVIDDAVVPLTPDGDGYAFDVGASDTGDLTARFRITVTPPQIRLPLPIRLRAESRPGRVDLSWPAEALTGSVSVERAPATVDAWTVVQTLVRTSGSAAARVDRVSVTDLAPGTHRFRLRQVDADGQTRLSDVVTVDVVGVTAVSEAVPNPVRARGRIDVQVATAQDVRAAVYDVLGRRLATLHDGPMDAGRRYALALDADALRLPSGMYFVRVTGDTFTTTRRVTVVR